jgi:hypothetical protein
MVEIQKNYTVVRVNLNVHNSIPKPLVYDFGDHIYVFRF